MIKYVSPANLSELVKRDDGYLDSEMNLFPYYQGIPNFTYPFELPETDKSSLEWYKSNADFYDEFLPLTFKTFNVNEDCEREKILSKLNLIKGDSVLEIGCGSGRDSLKIAQIIGETGHLCLQDISYDILKFCVEKFDGLDVKPTTQISLANGCYLPFEDNTFDKVFHFGGINTFGDKKRAFSEMIRVVKPGGKIVVGDENMPVWLRETEFGKILMNSNPHYKYDLPIDSIPVEARNVSIDWVIGGVFYIISFNKGSGEPYADFDFKIPGIRGGTHRTRFYGHLEGLSPETIDLAKKARKATNQSMFDWLESAVKAAAIKDLNKDEI